MMPVTSAREAKYFNFAHPRTEEANAELDAAVKTLFTYWPWDQEMIDRGEEVRKALAEAYKAIIRNAEPSPNRTRALNCLTDARMLANAAITFKGLV